MAVIGNAVAFVAFPHTKVLRSNNVIDLESLLKGFEAEEQIPEKYQCEICELDTAHTKTTYLSKLSKYLVIIYQRYNPVDSSKDNRLVTFLSR